MQRQKRMPSSVSFVSQRVVPFFVLLMSWGFGHAISAADDRKSTRMPNLVIIMADDLGYGDLGCYGNQRTLTPHLDRLAKEGIRLTDFHSSGSVCSPTRCGLMTGNYQQRAGIPAVVSVRHKHLGMSPDQVTFAEVLKQSGYRTAIYGKWHLGYRSEFNPVHQGFDEFRGYVSGNVDFFSHVDQSGAYDWWNGTEPSVEDGYTTHLITRHAVRFIEDHAKQHHDKPFCLYLPHEAPHYPYQGPNDQAERTVGGKFKTTGARKDVANAYREMVEELDNGVGKVVATLKKHGLEDNTLVWFFSDNGANQKGSNGSLRGYKGSFWEGGHRVPSIAWWPGQISPMQVNDSLTITLDVFPTLVSLAGIEYAQVDGLDGADISQVLLEGETITNRQLFWGMQKQRAMRDGDWKLVMNPRLNRKQKLGTRKTKKQFLFNLKEDPGEKRDVSEAEGKRLREMIELIKEWDNSVGPSEFTK